jgi:hypothetical protein
MMYQRATMLVKSKHRLSWRAIMGANMLLVLNHFNCEGFLRLDREMFMPVKPNRNRGPLMHRGTDEAWAAKYPQPMFMQMLSHNSFPKRLRAMPREKILELPTLIGYFFRRAMGML